MAFCLPRHLAEDFIQALKDGRIDPVKMMDIGSKARRELLAKFVGEDNAAQVNALYETRLLLKNQVKGMKTWINKVAGITPKRKSDMISRVNKMDKALNPETEDAFLEDLVAQKLGVAVTMEEAGNISELARIATEKKEAMESGPRRELPLGEDTKVEKEYGMAGVAFRNYITDLKLGEQVTVDKFFADPVGTTQRLLFDLANSPSKTFMVAAGVSKNLKTAWDNSALLRQGLKVFFAESAVWRKNAPKTFVDMYNTIGGQAVLDEINASMISHPLYKDMVRDGLAIGVVEEETPQAELLGKIPFFGTLIGAANNAFTGFAYRTRADLYALYTENANKQGFTDTEGMGIGLLANSMGSRGALGPAERLADIINVTFFSLRNAKANFDVLTAFLLSGKKTSSFVKRQAAKELLKIGMGIYASLAIAAALGGDVEWDRRSTDFGTVKLGNTRYDFTGGMGSLVVLFQRLWSGQSKSATTGEVVSTRGTNLFTRNGLDLLIGYFTNKLAPLPSTMINVLLTGTTFDKDEAVTVGNTIRDLTAPITAESAIETWEDPDSGPLLLTLIAEFLGISTNTFRPKGSKVVGLGK